MSRIGLVPFDEPMLAALAADAPAYAARDGISLGPNGGLLEGVAGQTLAYMQRTGSSAPWAGYLAIDLHDRLVVGTCAYKGPPDADGMVEVAYFTFPTCEGRGCATAMARTLRDQAAASGAVRLVRAHTLPERNASARILAKLDFVFVGEVIDPEDGCVWRWDWPGVPRVRATPNRVA